MHTCCSNVVNSKVGKQTKRCEIYSYPLIILKLRVGVKHPISHIAAFFPNPHLLKDAMSVFLSLHLSGLNFIAICLCNKNPYFIFLLNQLVVYSFPTAVSSVAGNHMMDLLVSQYILLSGS